MCVKNCAINLKNNNLYHEILLTMNIDREVCGSLFAVMWCFFFKLQTWTSFQHSEIRYSLVLIMFWSRFLQTIRIFSRRESKTRLWQEINKWKNLWVESQVQQYCSNVHIFWEGHNIFAKSSPHFWLALHRTKVRWRFHKILWPSQNIWTLLLRLVHFSE